MNLPDGGRDLHPGWIFEKVSFPPLVELPELQSRFAGRNKIAQHVAEGGVLGRRMARLSKARRVLEIMQKQLTQMTAAHAEAEAHLAKLTVDEASVEKVVRDTPM